MAHVAELPAVCEGVAGGDEGGPGDGNGEAGRRHCGRRGAELAVGVAAPAGDDAVAVDGAGVRGAGGDGDDARERARGAADGRLARVVGAVALEVVVPSPSWP